MDKPQGLTSHQVVAKIRRLAGQKKVGHSGTLDPMATGLMQVMLGTGTKLGPYLTALDKAYEGQIVLGLATNTDDITGQTIEEYQGPWPEESLVAAAMRRMEGPLSQRPPLFSAIKIAGERAYKIARRGETTEIAQRLITVAGFKITAYEPPVIFFKAEVSKGCYIRSLARDLGEALGTYATLGALRRTQVGSFDINQAFTFAELEALPRQYWPEKLITPARAIENLPYYVVDDDKINWVENGRALPLLTGAFSGAGPGPVRILNNEGHLMAIYEYETPPIMDGDFEPPAPFLRPRRVL